MVKVYKDRQSNFTHIKNDIFNTADPKYMKDGEPLTAKAIGIFTYMWHLPDGWNYYVSELQKHFKEQRTAVTTAISELEKYGFIKRVWTRDEGKFATYDWILNESPLSDNPPTVNPSTDNSSTDNQPLESTKGTKYLRDKELSGSSGDEKSYDALNEYQKVWMFPNAVIQQDLIIWIDEFGNDLVNYAIQIAGRNNVSKMGSHSYLKAIFKAWKNNNITTLEEAKKQNTKHENNRGGYKKSNSPSGKEVGSYEDLDF